MISASMPVISTTHLTSETCDQLDRWCETIDLSRRTLSKCPTLIGPTDYGWLVYCTEDTNELPEDLVQCIEWARQKDHSYVLFDADGDEIEELPDLGGPAARIPSTLEGRPSR
jgi:hypothetical protein